MHRFLLPYHQLRSANWQWNILDTYPCIVSATEPFYVNLFPYLLNSCKNKMKRPPRWRFRSRSYLVAAFKIAAVFLALRRSKIFMWMAQNQKRKSPYTWPNVRYAWQNVFFLAVLITIWFPLQCIRDCCANCGRYCYFNVVACKTSIIYCMSSGNKIQSKFMEHR